MFPVELILSAQAVLLVLPRSVKPSRISPRPGPSRLETPTLCDTGGCHNRDNKSFVGFARSDFALVRKKNAIELAICLDSQLAVCMGVNALRRLFGLRWQQYIRDSDWSCTTTRPA